MTVCRRSTIWPFIPLHEEWGMLKRHCIKGSNLKDLDEDGALDYSSVFQRKVTSLLFKYIFYIIHLLYILQTSSNTLWHVWTPLNVIAWSRRSVEGSQATNRPAYLRLCFGLAHPWAWHIWLVFAFLHLVRTHSGIIWHNSESDLYSGQLSENVWKTFAHLCD